MKTTKARDRAGCRQHWQGTCQCSLQPLALQPTGSPLTCWASPGLPG